MRNFDFSSWQAILSTLLGIALITFIGVGIRLLVMQTIQQRRERENRQINERLRTLIAAYRTLGGSFTGNLQVDPTHLRDLRGRAGDSDDPIISSDRSRRIRDAVETALSDIILLGTEDQVKLAAHAATELAAGRPVPTAELVVSLRTFIRQVLDLEPVPEGLLIPSQGPARVSSSARGGNKAEGSRDEKGKQGGGAGGGAALGAGTGLGVGLSVDPDGRDNDSTR
jgi:hypothetical protein